MKEIEEQKPPETEILEGYNVGIAEGKLRESQSRYESVFNNNLCGIATSSYPFLSFSSVNNAFCKMLGYTRKELLAMKMSDINLTKDITHNQKLIHQLYSREIENFTIEESYVKKDGTLLHSITSIQAVYNEEGSMVESVGTIQDITEKKIAEDDLRESQQRYKSIFQNNLCGIAATNSRFNIISVNDAFCNMLGYSREELLTMGMTDVSLPEDVEKSKNLLGKLALREVEGFTIEKTYLKKDGGLLHALTSVQAVYDDEGILIENIATIQDITHKNVAEEALKQKQQLLDGVMENSAFVIFVKNLEGKYILINKEFEHFLRKDRNEIINACDYCLFPEKVAKRLHRIDQKVLKSKKLIKSEQKFFINGEEVTFISNKFPIFNEDNQPVAIGGIATNITELKKIEQALKESRGRFRTLAETAPVALMITRKSDDKILFGNNKFCSLFKYNIDDLPDLPVPKIYSNAEDRKALVKKLISSDALKGCEVLMKNSEGDSFWIKLSSKETVLSGEEVYFTALEDITERKNIQESLVHSQQQFQSLARMSPVGIFQTDSLGQIIYVNERWCEIAGLSCNSVLGKKWTRAVHKEDQERVWSEWSTSTQKHVPFESEFRFLRLDNSISWLIGQAEPIVDPNGVVEGFVGTITDITARKNDEEERAKLIQELELKNSEMERFTYTVSHDLKSPLITIKGFVGMLEEDIKENDVERIETDIKYINSAVDNMNLLLHQLLDLSRAVNTPIKYKLTSLESVINTALDNVKGQILESGAVIDVISDLPDVLCDAPRIVEVFQNLFDNAIKFRRPGTSPSIKIKAEKTSSSIICTIKDDGVGINPKYLHKVFDLFERIDAKIAGTGVGLALVKRIIEKHNGKIVVESDGINKGCTFQLTLPIKR